MIIRSYFKNVCFRPSLRKKIDYLMYCWRPKLGDHFDELFEIIKYGFKDPIEYKVRFKFILVTVVLRTLKLFNWP